jgi:hypothetical protein
MDRFALRMALSFFLMTSVLLTVVCLVIYGAVQNDERSSANDPQVQIATQGASLLDRGARPGRITRGALVDLARSQAVHVTVFRRDGRVLASNARLGGTVPVPPAGVLTAAVRSGMNKVTWEPQAGVRVAAVIVPWHRGTILVGRSLAATEERESSLQQIVICGWLLGLLALALSSALAVRLLTGPGSVPPLQ